MPSAKGCVTDGTNAVAAPAAAATAAVALIALAVLKVPLLGGEGVAAGVAAPVTALLLIAFPADAATLLLLFDPMLP